MAKEFGLLRAITRPGNSINWWHFAVGIGLIYIGSKFDTRMQNSGYSYIGKSYMYGKPEIRYDSDDY